MRTTKKFYYLAAIVALLGLLWPATLAAQEELVCETEVTVQADDWLSKIAEKEYGDLLLYPALAAATNARAATDSSFTAIDNPDVIEPGWKICVPSLAQAQALAGSGPASPNPADLTTTELRNATYSGIYETPVTLTDGLYEGEPFVEGSASRPIVAYLSEIYGDLDGDGLADAAVFLVENSGGTGNFVYVAAQLNQNGQPASAGAVWLEDRIQIKAAAIADGQIMLEIITEGPGDAACCKSHKAQVAYALQDGQLVQVSSQTGDLERIAAADLNGTAWSLLEINEDQPVLPKTEVTLSFADGQISGSGGCNSYNSGFSLGDDNPFVMSLSPVVATRRACPDPILNQETTYFTALENVSQWGYQVGNLALYYSTADGGFGRLLFEPAATAATEVIDFVPAEIPGETQAGSCFTHAIGLGRADAWRCTVGNQIFDPCFAVGDEPTLVCGANPASGETGFRLELTEPLPAAEVGQLAQPWLLELEDGQVCGLMTGTVPGVGERVAPFGCPDGSNLFEDIQQGEVWQAEKAVIGLNEDGYFVESSETVPIRRVWR